MANSKAKQTGGGILVIALIIALFTDPSDIKEHKKAAEKYYNQKNLGVNEQNSDVENAVNTLENIDKIFTVENIKMHISVKDFYFFSLTMLSNKDLGTNSVIGIGIFGKVFIFG